MLTTDAVAYVRPDDDELVGYLVPEGDAFVPVTIFGYPLAAAGDEQDAISVLRERGLACLAEPWLYTRPDGAEVAVAITAAFTGYVDVAETEYGFFGPDSPRHRVAVADADRLRLAS